MQRRQRKHDVGRYPLTRESAIRIADAAGGYRDRALVRLLVDSGARRAEAAALRWDDVDVTAQAGGASFRFGGDAVPNAESAGCVILRGKTGARIVPLTHALAGALRALQGADVLAGGTRPVFRRGAGLHPYRREGSDAISTRTVNRIVAEAGRVAGVTHPHPNRKGRPINPHLLRHSWCRWLKSLGLDAESLKYLMGHSTVVTTLDVYGQLEPGEVARRFVAAGGA